MVRQSKQYLLSVIIPSRKRANALNDTITSLLSLSDKTLDNFEIIIKFDFDDKETLDYISQWSNEYKNISFVINSRLDGWYNLVDFVLRCFIWDLCMRNINIIYIFYSIFIPGMKSTSGVGF